MIININIIKKLDNIVEKKFIKLAYSEKIFIKVFFTSNKVNSFFKTRQILIV